eukprot:TRINITY_DN1558_c0_g1_i15.p1 TRINITY_DN1558_c0_g1~~TRINITY_DN1558_c0_g1_i15.p1  ORF type:complete len:193 (+),score=14.95 TRINITY_DN1558_c0_g1_i15:614-1192(+)
MGVVENLSETVILGRDFLVDNGAIIYNAKRCIMINEISLKRKLSCNVKLNKVLENFKRKFDELNKVWTGSSKLKPMKIQLKKECKPIRAKPNRYSPNKRRIVEDLLKKGIIEVDHGAEWQSPAVLVQNENGTYKLCVWFRHINKLVVRNHHSYQIPFIWCITWQVGRYSQKLAWSFVWKMARLNSTSHRWAL